MKAGLSAIEALLEVPGGPPLSRRHHRIGWRPGTDEDAAAAAARAPARIATWRSGAPTRRSRSARRRAPSGRQRLEPPSAPSRSRGSSGPARRRRYAGRRGSARYAARRSPTGGRPAPRARGRVGCRSCLVAGLQSDQCPRYFMSTVIASIWRFCPTVPASSPSHVCPDQPRLCMWARSSPVNRGGHRKRLHLEVPAHGARHLVVAALFLPADGLHVREVADAAARANDRDASSCRFCPTVPAIFPSR